MSKIFISGLSRNSGKTLVCAGIAATMQSLSYSTGIFKPIRNNSGLLLEDLNINDFKFVKLIDSNILTRSVYNLSGNLTPFVGAYEDGLKFDVNYIYSEYLSFSSKVDCTLIEGANSISTPIAQNIIEADIVKLLKLPLVLVVNPNFDSLDSVIAAVNFIQFSNLEFLGIIINQYSPDVNDLELKYYPQIIKEFLNVDILGYLPCYKNVSELAPEILIADVLTNLDIEKVFGTKIAKLA